MGIEISIDRRITRTKLAIRSALVSLIEEKGFDDVSVSEITNRADINRGTFYLHYRDKFELLDCTVNEVIFDIEKIFLDANSLIVNDFISVDQPLPIAVKIFEYVKDNEALMRALFGLGGGVPFLTKLRQVAENNLKLGFLANLKAINFLVPREYLISYMLLAHYGVIQSWLDTGCKESPGEMARILSRLSLEGPLRIAGFELKN